jgi:DNA-binding MarR family transcriptional regulator
MLSNAKRVHGGNRMATSPEWAHPADECILRYLNENPPEYIPLVANKLGMHLGYVEQRVETLVEQGLLEPITGEVIYTVTERGERYLAEGDVVALATDG